jgi:hypothetical protein
MDHIRWDPSEATVNKARFPRDTIQRRVPNREWLEHWLDTQTEFDAVWDGKVGQRILHNLSLLLNRSFKTVQELNRYRKDPMRNTGGAKGSG